MISSQPSALEQKLEHIRREAEERDAERRALKSGFAYVNLRKTPISTEAVRLIPESISREVKIAAVEIKQGSLAVVAYDPTSPRVIEEVKKLQSEGYVPKIFTASLASLEQAWRLYEFIAPETKKITGQVSIEHYLEQFKNLSAVADAISKIEEEKVNTTQIFEMILAGALALKASDVHFEAGEKMARIRFRLDGLLHDAGAGLPQKNYDSLLSRIKLLSGLKINIHGEAQDGRLTIDLPKKQIEIRVSIIPSEFGETIVMRVLDPDAINVTLEQLGLRPDDMELVHRELQKPNGLILNTGPTGSGKTTTLYSFLREMVNPEIKIITIEDPIEYRIEGIEQTQVDPEVGYTFANGLRAILRQDPDSILVGEIRDKETADIAMQASLTGHMVFSTLHTNDAVGAIPRLIDLGIRPATVGPALSLIIGQRLVRKLCEKCREAVELTPEMKENIYSFLRSLPAKAHSETFKNLEVYKSHGCEECNGTGYRGRVGIFEFFETRSEEFQQVVGSDASEVSLRKIATKQEMIPMQSDGILKVIKGVTSFSEIEGVTGPIDWQKLAIKK